MKNANIFIDVDLTIVDANGMPYEGIEPALKKFVDAGCHLFLWSSVGVDYARQTAERLGLTSYFEGYASKPDIIIDDMPSTTEPVKAYDVNAARSWPALAEKIVATHVD